MASITGIDERRSHLGAQQSSPVSRVVSVPFRTGPLPWLDEIARVGWKADTEIELRERCERSSILRHGQTATRTRSSGSAHASCRLNDEPHDQSGDDEQHQCAHSRSRSPVTRGTWGLPIAPPDVRSHVREYRSLNRHRPACRMLSDMVWRGSFHRHIITSGGTTATPVRTAQPKNESTFSAMPMMNAANTQSMARMSLIETSCMFQV